MVAINTLQQRDVLGAPVGSVNPAVAQQAQLSRQNMLGGVKPQMQTMAAPTAMMNQQPQQAPGVDPAVANQQYGLSGAEQALTTGFSGGLNALQSGANVLGGDFSARASSVDPLTGQPLFQQAAQGVGAYSPAGLQAQNLQSALSGAQGQEAFNQALLDSPIQRFLQEQGQQAVVNQAAATGGLGGGAVQQELQRVGQGIAGQQLQQQIANLQNLSGQGLQAAGQQGQFLSQAGQQQGNLAAQNAQLQTQASLASAGNRLGAAQGIANLAGQGAGLYERTGQNIGQARFQAGRDLATQIGQGTSALSNLANQQGGNLSDILGQGGVNVSNIMQNAGNLNAQQQTQLAQLLSNLSTGQGSQLSQNQLLAGQIGANQALQQGANQQQLLGNLAGAYGVYAGQQQPQTNNLA